MASPKPAQPSPSEVASIVALDNRIVRNLRITECYSRLSACVRAVTGEGANWCTFATWASRQAGCTIRGEDLGDRLGDIAQEKWSLRHPIRAFWRVLLRRGLFDAHTRLGRLVAAVHTPFDALERASEAVAEGNRKVFAEIGLEFARYLACCDDAAAFDDFLTRLTPGPAPGGQDRLRAAFALYQRARVEPITERRAQYLLAANLQIGFHEQTRLQPEIERAMHSGTDTAEDLKRRIAAHLGLRGAFGFVASLLAVPAERYRRYAQRVTRRVVSETLMVLRTPGRVLLLGQHLDADPPVAFRSLDLAELQELVRSVEPEGKCSNCGAEDWADLGQRMHYIYHLFAALHADAQLFEPPFTAEQALAMRDGVLPTGPL